MLNFFLNFWYGRNDNNRTADIRPAFLQTTSIYSRRNTKTTIWRLQFLIKKTKVENYNGKVRHLLKKINIKLLLAPAISILIIYPRDIRTYIHTRNYTRSMQHYFLQPKYKTIQMSTNWWKGKQNFISIQWNIIYLYKGIKARQVTYNYNPSYMKG